MKRIGTPSGVPEQPVLIVGPCTTEITELCRSMRAVGWTLLTAEDRDRASWLASIQKVALILIAGDPDAHEVAHVIRPVSNAPLVVLGAPTPQSVISLVEAGVDVRHVDERDALCSHDEILDLASPELLPDALVFARDLFAVWMR